MYKVRKLTYEQNQALEDLLVLLQFPTEEIPADALIDAMFTKESYKKE